MTTQSTVALGIEVGSALAMTPVYAAVRMSQSAKRKLRQSMTNRRWLEPLTKVVGQLKYSGVGGLVVRSRLSVTDDAEAKKTAGVGLQATGFSVYRIIAQSAVKAMGIVRAAVGWVVPVDAVEEDETAIAPSSTPSDIVQPNSAQYNCTQSGEISSDKAQGSLVWPIHSFWVAVLRAIANSKSRRNVKNLKSAFATLPEATAKALYGKRPSTRLKPALRNALPLPQSKSGGDLISVSVSEVDIDIGLEAAADRLLDAKVVAFEYVEHPLETVLKWIDRLLTWVEGQWQILMEVWRRWLLRRWNS
ncbi:MAG: hypothetical protein WA949_06740 [Phormidesmis sp.]